jgi:hypothetical protein
MCALERTVDRTMGAAATASLRAATFRSVPATRKPPPRRADAATAAAAALPPRSRRAAAAAAASASATATAAAAAPRAVVIECDGALVDVHTDGHRVAFNAAFKERDHGCVQWTPGARWRRCALP